MVLRVALRWGELPCSAAGSLSRVTAGGVLRVVWCLGTRLDCCAGRLGKQTEIQRAGLDLGA